MSAEIKKYIQSEYIIPILVLIWSIVLGFLPFDSQAIEVVLGAIIIAVLIINSILKLGKAKGMQLIIGLILLVISILGFFMGISLLRVSLIANNGIILLSIPIALAMSPSMGGSISSTSGTTRNPSPSPSPEPSGGPEPM
ncbi:MAG: hypothetical protein ACOC44_14005 [Promethearchaeia archaeon]